MSEKQANGRVTIRDVYDIVKDLRKDIEQHYVHKNEFVPVKTVVYGMVGLILTGVMTAVVAQVVRALP